MITLNTYDDAQLLTLAEAPASEYNSDLCFSLTVASPMVRASSPFQVSQSRLSLFLGQTAQDEVTLHDENGDGLIKVLKEDSLGHYRITVEVGGPWDDQARVSFKTDQTAISSFFHSLTIALATKSPG
ncbi:hypothetical protein ACXR2T_09360 [Leucobacter sp. HY1910]